MLLIFDGVNDKNKELFESINKIIDYDQESGDGESRSYYSWKASDKCKLNIREGKYKNVRIIVVRKLINKGKKDSLIVGESIISDMYSDEYDIIYSYEEEVNTNNAFIYQ